MHLHTREGMCEKYAIKYTEGRRPHATVGYREGQQDQHTPLGTATEHASVSGSWSTDQCGRVSQYNIVRVLEQRGVKGTVAAGTRRCRIPTGAQASPTTMVATRTAWWRTGRIPASGTTGAALARASTSASSRTEALVYVAEAESMATAYDHGPQFVCGGHLH